MKLMEPIQIGPVRSKNRIFRSAHTTWFGDGSVTDEFAAYHEERARDGVGVTMLELLSVHPSTNSRLEAWNPRLEKDYAKLVRVSEKYDTLLMQQIWHGGHNHITVVNGVNPLRLPAPWSSCDRPGLMLGVTPIPMTKSMIDEVVEGFASSARLCERAGLHGVEIHAAHGYLLHQFLSANLNEREDEYGGSLENRARFVMEVCRAVRSGVSKNFAVGVRLSPDLVPGGVDVATNQYLVERLEAEKLIDFVNLSLGSYHSFPKLVGAMQEPVGYELPTSIPIAQRANVVRMAIGRFRTLDEAEQVLRDSPIDMIGLTRAMIADPTLIRKTLAGQSERVRPCIACNQGCVAGLEADGRMGCAVNPAVGYEATLSEELMKPAAKKRNVVVVGGGPAGLEAARIAALRSHKVTLFEASSEMGGMLNFAAMCPTRHGIRDIAVWQEAEIFHLGVDVRMNTYAETEDILALSPDAVIIATGSYPRVDGWIATHPHSPVENFDSIKPMSSLDVLSSNQSFAGKHIIVSDDVGHYEAVGTSEFLVNKGADVTFVSRHAALGFHVVGASAADTALERLMRDGRFHRRMQSRVVGFDGNQVRIQTIHGGPVETKPCDAAVFVSANKPNRDLYFALDKKVKDVILVGDAHAPRFLQIAISEGHFAARNL